MKAQVAVVLLTALSALPAADTLPTIAVLSTGGTIASKHDPGKGGYEPALTGEALVDALPGLRKLAQIKVEQITNISSSDMTPAIWLRLAQRANQLLSNPEIAGIVVTHGANTLEETAFFLDLTVENESR